MQTKLEKIPSFGLVCGFPMKPFQFLIQIKQDHQGIQGFPFGHTVGKTYINQHSFSARIFLSLHIFSFLQISGP